MRASFIRNSTVPKSFPATLDVRTKLLLCVLSSLSAVILHSPLALTPLLAGSVVYALTTKKTKGILAAYLVVSIMLGISMTFMVLLGMAWPELTEMKLKCLLVPFFRIVLMLNVVLVLAFTSRTQPLQTALKSLHIPTMIYIPTAIMIRFIPTFFNDTEQVIQNLNIRGYPLTPRTLFLHPLQSMQHLFVPLVFRALRSSDDLAVAAELKGVSISNAIASHRKQIFSLRDRVVSGLALALVACAFAIQARYGGFSMGVQ